MSDLDIYTGTEMERSLISGCWASLKDAAPLRQLEARDFTDEAARVGFSVIRKIIERGDDCSILVMRQELVEQGRADVFQVLSNHMMETASDVLTPAEIRAMIRKIERCSTLRSARWALTQAIKYLDDDGTSTPAQIQENVTKTVAMAFSRLRSEGGIMERDGILALAERMVETEFLQLSGNSGVLAIPTGFADLDDIIVGGEPEDLIILAGPTSSGKSALAQQIAREWARSGHVYYWSGEMSSSALSRRAAIQEAKTSDLRSAQVYEIAENRSRKVYYDTAPATAETLAARVELYSMRTPIKALIVDYVGHLCATDYKSTSEASKALVRLKKSLKVPILALVQFSRKVYDRTDKAPMLSDLKESGQLENDADKVLMIHKPSIFDKAADENEVSLWVRKNREGRRDDEVKLSWNGESRSFGRYFGPVSLPRNPALMAIPTVEIDVEGWDYPEL